MTAPSSREQERYHARELAKLRKARRAPAKAARPVSPKANRGRERCPGFLAFLRRQPCAVGPLGCSGPIQACHVRHGRPGEPPTGLQRKPSDRRAVGMCRGHHLDGPDAQHKSGERQWWAARGIDPHALADALYAAYLAGLTEYRGADAD